MSVVDAFVANARGRADVQEQQLRAVRLVAHGERPVRAAHARDQHRVDTGRFEAFGDHRDVGFDCGDVVHRRFHDAGFDRLDAELLECGQDDVVQVLAVLRRGEDGDLAVELAPLREGPDGLLGLIGVGQPR